jgi:hypothetical protein
MPDRVIESINNETGDLCMDIFMREDGSFGFEEFRRDPEDLRGWFPLHRHGARSFASLESALQQARLSVAWMAK